MIRDLYRSILNWQPIKKKPVIHLEKSKAQILEDSARILKEMGLLSPKMEEGIQ